MTVLNDDFRGQGVFAGMQNFEMTIWNRYGQLLFNTNDPFEGWPGIKNDNGEPLPTGVYVYLVTYNGPRGEPFKFKGFATLIR